jgi:tetratricopeptide (TPR) repeat protein
MKFAVIGLLLLCNTILFSFAQTDIAQANYATAVELFDKEKFAAAKILFEQYVNHLQSNPDAFRDNLAQAYSKLSLCALYLKNPDFEYYITQLSEKFSSHPLTLITYTKIGDYFFKQGDYAQASRFLRKLNLGKPTKSNVGIIYQLAYSTLMNKDEREASRLFNLIKGGEHEYAYLSSYYAAYIGYHKGDYKNALTDILKAIDDQSIKSEAEALLVATYYKQKRYQDAINYILKNKKTDSPVFDLLLADSYFMQGDSTLALTYFERYIKKSNKAQTNRDLLYKVATAYTSSYINKLPQAAYYFSKIADDIDSLAQVSAYQLGITYLRLQDKNAAINAFDKCRKLYFDKDLQKSSAFHYIKLNFEMDNAKNALEGCLFYEKNFQRNDSILRVINNLRNEAYLNTQNNLVAIQYIEQMKEKDIKAQLAYQRITFNRAVELFNNKEYIQSKSFLIKSLTYPHNSEIVSSTYFVLGEISNLLNRPDLAIESYQKVGQNTKYKYEVFLGLGYAYFQKENFINTIHFLNQYLTNPNPKYLIEAYTKLADAYFKQNDFANALKNYELALVSGSTDFPYSRYQRALCLIELKRTAEAEDLLDVFITQHSNHSLIDWANYQKALIQYKTSKTMAINLLNQIVNHSAETKILPYAMLKRGDIYVEIAVINRAINDYKNIIEKYPSTPPAEQAIQRLQDLQMKGIHVPNYNHLLSRNIRPQTGNPLAADFALKNANHYIEEGDYKSAIGALSSFLQGGEPKSESTSEAEYLLGISYQNLGEEDKANIYLERSGLSKGLLKSAQIDLKIGYYQNAISKCEKILKTDTHEEEKREAKIGILKAYAALKNHEKVMYYLDELKNNVASQPTVNLHFGKIYFAQEQYDEALKAFQKVIEATNDIIAAEAQYQIGLIYRIQGDYIRSTEELKKIKEKYEIHTDWLYESLFLIAENYLSSDNMFQAKATIQWLIDNSQYIKVILRAKEKMNEWN